MFSKRLDTHKEYSVFSKWRPVKKLHNNCYIYNSKYVSVVKDGEEVYSAEFSYATTVYLRKCGYIHKCSIVGTN